MTSNPKKPSPFVLKVWQLAQSIPPGRVTTYGLLTVAAGGHPMMAQMITHILSKCPDQSSIPYHRIVYANGRVWLEPKYDRLRRRLYKQEGIALNNKNHIIDFETKVFTFT